MTLPLKLGQSGSRYYCQLEGFPRHHFTTKQGQVRVLHQILKELQTHQAQFQGAGLFDTLKSHIKGILLALKGNRRNLKPSDRAILNQLGDQPIIKMYVCRRPLGQTFDQALTLVEKLSDMKTPHDLLFHLFLVVEMSQGQLIRIEKNENINIVRYTESKLPEEIREVPVPKGLTIQRLLDRTLETVGPSRFFDYDAFNTNCQRFVYDLLQSNHLPISGDLHHFILQKVSDLAPAWGRKIAYFLTSLKNRANLVVEGEGHGLSKYLVT